MTPEDAVVKTKPASAVDEMTLRWVRGCAIALAILGAFIRLDGLGSKVFWHDEAHTGRVIAGSRKWEVVQEIFDGRVHTRAEMLAHQFPRESRTTADTVRVLAREDPRQVMLYFVLARAWVKAFGSSTEVLRAFSAVLGILALPLVFLLARELFGRSLEGWTAVGLLAVSPLFFVYSQEARQYMLWVDFVLLASWLLLLAQRRVRERGRAGWWWFVLYAGAIALALLTHLLTVLVMAAHLLFVFLDERLRLKATVWLTACSHAVVAALFWPWARLIIVEGESRPWIPWAAKEVSFSLWSRRAAGSYAKTFFDIGDGSFLNIGRPPAVLALLVAVVCVVLLIRFAAPRARLFVLLLGSACSLPMIAVDLWSGGVRTLVTRYQFPALIALELAAAFGLACLLASREQSRRLAGAAAAVFLVSCGLYSAVFYVRAEIWWSKSSEIRTPAAVRTIEQRPAPLVVTSKFNRAGVATALSFAHTASGRTRLVLVVEPEMPVIPDGFEDVFVWRVSKAMRERFLDAGWRVEKVDAPDLYRLFRPR